jgi:CRISPR-associated protein Cmr5
MAQQTTAQSRQRLLEQERAKAAWDCVQQVKREKVAAEYRSLARSAPADIQANGLGQTLAFWRAKGYENGRPKQESAHRALLEHVSRWLASQLKWSDGGDALAWITQRATTPQYRVATVEAIAFLNWVKRFAEAELPSSGE